MTKEREPEIPEDGSGRPVPSGAAVEVMSGFYSGLRIQLDRDWMVIGRGRTADLVFSEPTISRAHAAIGYEQGEFFVQDLGSTNGTRVNDQRGPRSALGHGDQIQLGRLLFRFELAA